MHNYSTMDKDEAFSLVARWTNQAAQNLCTEYFCQAEAPICMGQQFTDENDRKDILQ